MLLYIEKMNALCCQQVAGIMVHCISHHRLSIISDAAAAAAGAWSTML
jgi:hypothetical protein